MNELILELADQAAVGVKGPLNIPDEFCLKFAELIAKQCVVFIQDESYNSGDDWEIGLRIAQDIIAERFEVQP